MTTEPIERDDWDAHWERYAEAAGRNPAQRMRHALITRFLRERAGSAAMRVMDVGSGQGDLLVKLRSAFPAASLFGVELSRAGVEISRRKAPEATVLEADMFNPPDGLRPFIGWATHAVCSEVLEHVDSPAAFLEAVRPYLTDGSILVVTVPGGPMSAFDRHIGHRRHFTRESIAACLDEAGFEADRVCLCGFPFFNAYRATVIARGERLARDVEKGQRGAGGALARAVMAAFRALFRFNLTDSRFGWQVVAVARKRARAA